MAEVRVHHAEVTTPAAPVVRVHQAALDIPPGMVIRVHHAQLALPAPSSVTVRVHYAALALPAAQDAVPPSGIRQLSGDAWWDVPLYQRSAGEWV